VKRARERYAQERCSGERDTQARERERERDAQATAARTVDEDGDDQEELLLVHCPAGPRTAVFGV
jgi:hypothetical protein